MKKSKVIYEVDTSSDKWVVIKSEFNHFENYFETEQEAKEYIALNKPCLSNNEKIKTECELMYKQIEDAQNRLKEIRALCKHENTFKGDWSWRVGSSMPATICDDCGSLVKFEQEWKIK